MPTQKTIMGGFKALDNLPTNSGSKDFNKLESLMTLKILPTPPDNNATVRFLTDDFSLVMIHGWVKMQTKNAKGDNLRKNILCKKSFDRGANCPLCNAGIPSRNRGLCRVGLLDTKDQIIYDTYDDANPEDYAEYAEVMDSDNIVKTGNTLTLKNIPAVRILDMGVNFWRTMSTFQQKYGTICDRGYTIFRQGRELETTYTIAPSDKDTDYKTPELLQTTFEPGLDFCMSVDKYLEVLSKDWLYEDFEVPVPVANNEEDNGPSLHDILK